MPTYSSILHQNKAIVIATRQSALALRQAELIQHKLITLYPQLKFELLGMTTSGDQLLDTPLSEIGGKGLFIKELEQALLDGRADLAVHSMKDVPMDIVHDLEICTITQREDVRDAFISQHYSNLESMPDGAIIGTSSLRRQSQIKAHFPHLQMQFLRGNLQTRLKRLAEGKYDAIILASAGLIRLQLTQYIRAFLDVEMMIPAIGQGALGIEIASHRQDLKQLLLPLNAQDVFDCVSCERAFGRALAGSCTVPLGAYARYENHEISLQGFVASPNGKKVLRGATRGDSPEQLGEILAETLIAQGAMDILHEHL